MNKAMKSTCESKSQRLKELRSLANSSSIGTRLFYDPSRGEKLEGKASMSYKAQSSETNSESW